MFWQRGPNGRKQITRRCLEFGSSAEEAWMREERGSKDTENTQTSSQYRFLYSPMQLNHE